MIKQLAILLHTLEVLLIIGVCDVACYSFHCYLNEEVLLQ